MNSLTLNKKKGQNEYEEASKEKRRKDFFLFHYQGVI